MLYRAWLEPLYIWLSLHLNSHCLRSLATRLLTPRAQGGIFEAAGPGTFGGRQGRTSGRPMETCSLKPSTLSCSVSLFNNLNLRDLPRPPLLPVAQVHDKNRKIAKGSLDDRRPSSIASDNPPHHAADQSPKAPSRTLVDALSATLLWPDPSFCPTGRTSVDTAVRRFSHADSIRLARNSTPSTCPPTDHFAADPLSYGFLTRRRCCRNPYLQISNCG
jgi:hypothetical protein